MDFVDDTRIMRQTMAPDRWDAAEKRALAWLREHHDTEAPLSYVALLGRGRAPKAEG